MPKDDSRLGKGLSAIFGEIDNLDGKDTVQYLPIDSILPNPNQPRQDIVNEELQSLAKSIKENGIIGVGLITLADEIVEYIHSRIKPMSQDEWSR